MRISDWSSDVCSSDLLTEGAIRASDKRAQFVGVDVYEAAGGAVMRDLFQQDDGGWLQDPTMLDRLVVEKLTSEAETRSEEHTSELQSLMRISYAVFCLKKKKKKPNKDKNEKRS